jgi:hypothetical protein
MPLRDHFHSPVADKRPWDGVYGGWPVEIVRTLFDLLPPEFAAQPRIYHPAPFEVGGSWSDVNGGTSPRTVPDLAALDEYEVLVYDADTMRTLVAAIEIVSPSNKDRDNTREQFVNKVAALLRQDVCVIIVDIVTTRHANLYAELLARLGRSDPTLAEPPMLYAVTLRGRKQPKKQALLDAWFFPLTIGQPLPTLPVWLGPELRIELPLEPSYQEVCRLLHIP